MPLNDEVREMCAHYRWKPFADRYHRRKIYDMLIVNDELETLALRMAEMDQVDYFIIVESEITFSGNPKPLYVAENLDYFPAEVLEKMIVANLNETFKGYDTLTREDFSRDAALEQVLPLLEDEMIPTHGDILISGNVDEMLRPEVLTAMRNCDIPRHVRLWTRAYHYSFQWLHPSPSTDGGQWQHPDATFFSGWKGETLKPSAMREDSRKPDSRVFSAGWRCSFCFPAIQDIVNKVASSGKDAQRLLDSGLMDPTTILRRVREGRDILGRTGVDAELFRIDNNKDVPGHIVRHAERFGYMLDRDGVDGGFVDAAELVGEDELRRGEDEVVAEESEGQEAS